MRQPPNPRPINLIVIHCTATPDGRVTTVADVDAWHKQRGFAGIGYHYLIGIDGKVGTGRPLGEAGAHALNYNSDSIGIALAGSSRYTQVQWDALAKLVRDLACRYSLPLSVPDFRRSDAFGATARGVVGHNELPKVAKACPGFSVGWWLGRGLKPMAENVLQLAPDEGAA